MVKGWIQRSAAFALFLVGFNFCEHFSHQKTDGFSLHRIQFSTLPATFDHAQAQSHATSILQQPFHYLDCGNQCFAFLSDDRQYVLKFFKYANPPVPHFLTTIPLLNHFKPFRPHRFERVMKKQQRDFQGYRLAYDRFKEETGLLAVHLDPSDQSYPVVTLIDKLGSAHQLDLNTAPFILQKKASPVYPQLREWIAAGDLEQAKQGVTSLMHLLKKRMRQQLQDDDVHFYSNFGFIGPTAVQVDPGHFTAGTSINPELEIKALSHELIRWCEKNAPKLIPTVEYETHSP